MKHTDTSQLKYFIYARKSSESEERQEVALPARARRRARALSDVS